MTNRGAVSQALNCGGEYTIPSGYHNGSGKVTANSLSSQTSADAVAANILKDKTAWVNGSKITGTMVNNGAVAPAALGAGGSYTIPAGYHNGSGKVTVSSLATITSGGTITNANQILSGYKAYSDGTLYTGSMTNQGAQTKTFSPSGSSQSYTIPAGYHNGSGKVTCNAVSNLTAANIKKGVTVGGVTGTFSGYVAGSTDLYLRGNNIKNWKYGTAGAITFESGGIFFNDAEWRTSSPYTQNSDIYSTNIPDLSPYSYLNIELCWSNMGMDYATVKMNIYNSSSTLVNTKFIISSTIKVGTTGTFQISLSDVSLTPAKLGLIFGCGTSVNDTYVRGYSMTGYIYRIWLS